MKAMALGVMLSLLTTGCATIETKRGVASQYAPTNEVKGGTAKYNSQGLGREGRREGAYKKMYQHCGGPYRITGERSAKEGAIAVPVGNMWTANGQSWTYLDFECEAAK